MNYHTNTLKDISYELALPIIARALDKLLEVPKLKFEKIHPLAKTPTKAHDSDMCFDLIATSHARYKDDFKYIEYSTGLRFEIPEGYGIEMLPRSSISNYELVLSNSVGQIDTDYRGELLVRFKPIISPHRLLSLEDLPLQVYQIGDKIVQMKLDKKISCELIEGVVSENTSRSSGGFGSTGK